jgi:sulfate adenylyltransferase
MLSQADLVELYTKQKQHISNIDQGFCIYIIGISGAGKSTLSRYLAKKLSYRKRRITILDGDEVRQNISKGLTFSAEDRSTNVRRIGYVASEIVKHGGIAICANIAPYDADRLYNRQVIEQYGGYFEIFMNTPIEVCRQRDPKKLYELANSDPTVQMTGAGKSKDSLFELPTKYNIMFDGLGDINVMTESVLKYIESAEY